MERGYQLQMQLGTHDRQALHPCILLLKISSPGQLIATRQGIEDFGTDRRCYYNRNYHVDRMIQQFTATFHFPEYESLTAEQLYPWQFMPAAGRLAIC